MRVEAAFFDIAKIKKKKKKERSNGYQDHLIAFVIFLAMNFSSIAIAIQGFWKKSFAFN